ncbi:tyrosine-type recombinase/integrase [Candidatus Mycolicibacterium alkanivorans]|uniref:Site-specific integrase n=1 Tax=Candidatus Mycolicibacterium alkanivorans TaxID=2954114 RepID=A0ABS9YVR1_9MYCO|nr:site-specific integrase [Candidatus Mycolicibacterium alkanivorans]MCI4675285.1 site-specific integrase [Candidatus Mycolicibacterium alkanivorans]
MHVEPVWARTQLSAVSYSTVQAWTSELAQRRGAKVVRYAHGVLYGICEDAVRDSRLASNPCRGVKLPPIVKKPNVYLTGDQLHALARESGRYGSLVLLLGTAGLRWGEAAGLRVGDVDFLRRKILVHKNATGGSVESLKGGEHRTLAVAKYVVDELATTVAGKGRDELIWPSSTGGYLRPPATHDSWLSGAVARCQKTAAQSDPFPRVTAHDLRHTAASLAISNSANVKVVQRMLGHKSAAMTLDVYADLFDDDLVAVADKLDRSVGKLWAPGLGLDA